MLRFVYKAVRALRNGVVQRQCDTTVVVMTRVGVGRAVVVFWWWW